MVIAVFGFMFEKTRKISSAKAWPIYSIPLKSRTTSLNNSSPLSIRRACEELYQPYANARQTVLVPPYKEKKVKFFENM